MFNMERKDVPHETVFSLEIGGFCAIFEVFTVVFTGNLCAERQAI